MRWPPSQHQCTCPLNISCLWRCILGCPSTSVHLPSSPSPRSRHLAPVTSLPSHRPRHMIFRYALVTFNMSAFPHTSECSKHGRIRHLQHGRMLEATTSESPCMSLREARMCRVLLCANVSAFESDTCVCVDASPSLVLRRFVSRLACCLGDPDGASHLLFALPLELGDLGSLHPQHKHPTCTATSLTSR